MVTLENSDVNRTNENCLKEVLYPLWIAENWIIRNIIKAKFCSISGM